MVADIGMRRRQQRVARARATITAARWEVGGWLADRRTESGLRHLIDHFEVLGTVVVRMLEALDGELDAIPGSAPSGEVYDTCRAVEGGVATVLAMFTAFARRYDQRVDGERFAPRGAGQPDQADVLAAADELALSCWTAPFAELGTEPPSLPLVYLEPNYGQPDEPGLFGELGAAAWRGADASRAGRHYAPAHRAGAHLDPGHNPGYPALAPGEAGHNGSGLGEFGRGTGSPGAGDAAEASDADGSRAAAPPSPAALAAWLAREMPLPAIAIPAWSVREAWWLATVARETGVLIGREFVPRGGGQSGQSAAEQRLGLDLTPAIAAAPVPREGALGPDVLAELADDWRRWREDAFADAYSVLMIGDAALWAASELEHTTAESFLGGSGSSGTGMPPVVRLALLDALVRMVAPGSAPLAGGLAESVAEVRRRARLAAAGARAVPARPGLARPGASPGRGPGGGSAVSPAPAEVLRGHLAVVPAIAEALLASQLAGTPLTTVSGVRSDWFATGGRVRSWSAALRRDPSVIPSGARRVRPAARQAIAAGVGAYVATVETIGSSTERPSAAPVPGRYGAAGSLGGRRSWNSSRTVGGRVAPLEGTAATLATLHNRLIALMISCGEGVAPSARATGETSEELAERLTARLVQAVRVRRDWPAVPALPTRG